MIKKRIRQTTAILTTACIFSACTQKTEQQPVVQMTEQQPYTEESNLERTTDLAGITEDVETSSSDTACFRSKSTAKIL